MSDPLESEIPVTRATAAHAESCGRYDQSLELEIKAGMQCAALLWRERGFKTALPTDPNTPAAELLSRAQSAGAEWLEKFETADVQAVGVVAVLHTIAIYRQASGQSAKAIAIFRMAEAMEVVRFALTNLEDNYWMTKAINRDKAAVSNNKKLLVVNKARALYDDLASRDDYDSRVATEKIYAMLKVNGKPTRTFDTVLRRYVKVFERDAPPLRRR